MLLTSTGGTASPFTATAAAKKVKTESCILMGESVRDVRMLVLNEEIAS
jgi:hypothetical protein